MYAKHQQIVTALRRMGLRPLDPGFRRPFHNGRRFLRRGFHPLDPYSKSKKDQLQERNTNNLSCPPEPVLSAVEVSGHLLLC